MKRLLILVFAFDLLRGQTLQVISFRFFVSFVEYLLLTERIVRWQELCAVFLYCLLNVSVCFVVLERSPPQRTLMDRRL